MHDTRIAKRAVWGHVRVGPKQTFGFVCFRRKADITICGKPLEANDGHSVARLWSRSPVNPVPIETAREVINDQQKSCEF